MVARPMIAGFGIERYLRKAERTPPEIAATPNMDELAYGYSAEKSERALSDKKFASDIALKQKELTEKVRESDIKNRFSNEELAIWKSQNNLATLLGAGATAMTGLGALVALKKAEGRDITQQKILTTQTEATRSQTEGLAAMEEMLRKSDEERLRRYFTGGVGSIVDNPWDR